MSAEAQELLRRPNFAHLATIGADGTPSIAPVWIDPLDPSTVIVATGEGSHKVRNLRRDPCVVISVVDFDNPYEELQLRGFPHARASAGGVEIGEGPSRRQSASVA